MILSFANQKGGVCKTTTVFTVGNILASQGMRVLMVDMDPQGSLSLCCGLKERMVRGDLPGDMQSVLCEGMPLADIALPVCGKRYLHLAPATIQLARAELRLVAEHAREARLARALAPVLTNYDYVLIDCPPSLGLLVVNALTASDAVIVPVSADYLACEGLSLMMESVESVRVNLNPRLRVLGVVLTLYSPRTLHAREVCDLLTERYTVLAQIGQSTQVKDAVLTSQSIADIAPDHPITAQYKQLVEVIARAQADER